MDTFELKYFSESRLMEISKKIQRERKKRHEEIEWQKFCQKNALELSQQLQEPHTNDIGIETLLDQRQPFTSIPNLSKSDCSSNALQVSLPCSDKLVHTQSELPLHYNKSCSCKLLSRVSEETSTEFEVPNIVSYPDKCSCENSNIALSPFKTVDNGVSSINFKKIALPRIEEESSLVQFTANINRDDLQLSTPSSFIDTKFTDDLHSIQESMIPTTDRKNDEKKNYVLVHLERVVVYQNKMDLHLDKISFLFDKIPKPFDMADKNRRELRAAGFATLFSRNNIYPLERKVSDIEKLLTNEASSSPAQGTNRLLSKRLVEAHHLASSSLGAYLSHMPTSVLTGVPEKLQKLLELIVDLANLCDQLQVTETGADTVRQIFFGDDLNRSKCQQMLIKVQDQMANIRRNELLSAEKIKHSFAASQPIQVIGRGQKGFRSKISPYAMPPFVTAGSFKKSFDTLARARFGPPPKTKDRKSNKLIQLKNKPSSVGGKKNTAKPTAVARKNSARAISDDTSETYVAQFPTRQNENKAETLTTSLYASQAQDLQMGDGTSITEKPLCNNDIISKKLLPKLTEITDYLEKNKDIASSVKELAQYIQHQMNWDEETVAGTRKLTSHAQKKTEKVFAKEKNAQLIILPENTSCHENETSTQHSTEHEKICRPTGFNDILTCIPNADALDVTKKDHKNTDDSQTHEKNCTNILPNLHYNSPVTPRSTISIRSNEGTESTENKNEPLFVSASSVNVVLRYTTQYEDFIRNIPVYRASLKPWKVISRVSNQFVEEALRDVIKELDFDYLVAMMYKLEFQ